MLKSQPIGVFDSGYGGLTVMEQLVRALPQYDFVYLGDNARAPYGNRSFETVYQYTLEAVRWFFKQGSPLVILACNTASAKALRSIQQKDLPSMNGNKRVLGVIRPTTEIIGNFSKSKQVGILATTGTVISGSYPIEIEKFFPDVKVFQQACPLWVPLIENNEHNTPGADYFIKKYIDQLQAQSKNIDTVLLACTHYPLIRNKIQQHLDPSVKIVSQGEIVAHSLVDYLKRHPELDAKISKQGEQSYFTTDSTADFDQHASIFYDREINSSHVTL
ncbi:MAG TPA: glutamate racemase [Puia sp.]|nr:glutamate racemase [Puia sp.]